MTKNILQNLKLGLKNMVNWVTQERRETTYHEGNVFVTEPHALQKPYPVGISLDISIFVEINESPSQY